MSLLLYAFLFQDFFLNFWKKSWKRKAYRSNDMAKYKAINEQDRCVACGVCVKVCPKDAISIYKGC